MCLNSGAILKVESIGFPDWLDAECDKKRGINGDSKIWGLRSLKYKICFNCEKEATSEAQLGREH